MQTHQALAIAFLLAVGLCPRVTLALEDSDKESVRILANDADSDFEAGHYEAAREKFTRAYGIAKVPTLALRTAQANERLGHFVAAYELYRQALDFQPSDLWKGDVQQQAQKEAEDSINKLRTRIPRLTISVEGANASDVSVTIDNAQVPAALLGVERLTDPGQHQIVGKRRGEVANETANLAEGERKQIVLRFGTVTATALTAPTGNPKTSPDSASSQPGVGGTSKPSPDSSGTLTNLPAHDSAASGTSRQRTLGWIGVGLGAAGLTLGAGTGLIVAIKYGDLNSKCAADHNCHGQYDSEVSTYNTMRTLSLIGFVVGGVATAGGLTLLLSTPKDTARPQVGLQLLPGTIALRGSF